MLSSSGLNYVTCVVWGVEGIMRVRAGQGPGQGPGQGQGRGRAGARAGARAIDTQHGTGVQESLHPCTKSYYPK
jgi:hypothetical protein